MISEEVLKELQCAFSNVKHFVIEPITLSNCGHAVCKNCLSNETSSVKCKICGVISEQDFSKTQTSKALKQALKICLGSIFDIIEKETSEKLNKLMTNCKIRNDELDLKIKSIEEAIDVRIESIHEQLEEIGLKLKSQLQVMKNDVMKIDGFEAETRINMLSINLEELQNSIKKKINFNEEFLEKNQNTLNELCRITDLHENAQIPEIDISKENINEKIVGELYFGKVDVTDLLLNGKKEICDLDVQPYDVIVLPKNNQILCANYSDKCLTLYDEKLSLIKKVDRINGEAFAPIGMVLNRREKTLYISDYDNNRILIIDLEFNKIKSVGQSGSGDDQFLGPFDMCFQNNTLYICDYYNKRVQIYSKDLELLRSLKVDYLTWKIKASNSKLCVESGDSSGIHFYNLDDLSECKTFNHGVCRISEINSSFYEINQKSKKVFCYDNHGNLKEEILLSGLDNLIKDGWDGTFIEIKGFLLMISSSKKKIIKFSRIKTILKQ